tara:strand:- start:918 stop:1106 length:189 start_codon:yes stop_codon:yes gene_type:complete
VDLNELTNEELEQRFHDLKKQVAKMERERQHTRDPDHKAQLRNLKKSKLLVKDMLDKTKKQC